MKDVLKKFDKFLYQNNEYLKATIIGGSALIIMDIISRKTKDVDLLDPVIPENIKQLSVEFSKQYPEFDLDSNWLNNGPIDLKKDLPTGWQTRLVIIFSGRSMALSTLGRSDLLKSKLFACCDRQFDFEDCISMRPTEGELDEALIWVSERDTNELWPKHVQTVFEDLRNEIRKSK
jgi:hypothetical protein